MRSTKCCRQRRRCGGGRSWRLKARTVSLKWHWLVHCVRTDGHVGAGHVVVDTSDESDNIEVLVGVVLVLSDVACAKRVSVRHRSI